MANSRLLYGAGAAVLALLILANILLVVVIVQNNAAAAQAEHERIAGICAEGLADRAGEDLDEWTACIQRLTSD